ncbi:hypothetical protein WG66_006578 [Moniliophthora roreri]|nr:hypothetical protein WG66_006578 [Moniliophthora roreri]
MSSRLRHCHSLIQSMYIHRYTTGKLSGARSSSEATLYGYDSILFRTIRIDARNEKGGIHHLSHLITFLSLHGDATITMDSPGRGSW